MYGWIHRWYELTQYINTTSKKTSKLQDCKTMTMTMAMAMTMRVINTDTNKCDTCIGINEWMNKWIWAWMRTQMWMWMRTQHLHEWSISRDLLPSVNVLLVDYVVISYAVICCTIMCYHSYLIILRMLLLCVWIKLDLFWYNSHYVLGKVRVLGRLICKWGRGRGRG